MRVKAAAQHSPRNLGSAFALHFTCNETLTLIIHHLKHQSIMNKTIKKILQVLSYIVTLLLGGAGASMM